MENVKGKRGGVGERSRSRDHVVEEFVPSAVWTEDSDCHFLLVDLPDFEKEEVKLQVDQSGQITVSGERLVNSNKYIYFEKAFKSPENSDINKTTQKFDGGILYVTLPKKPQVEKKEPNDEEGVAKDYDDMQEKEEKTCGDHERSGESNIDGEQIQKKEKSKKGSRIDGFDKEIVEKWEGECSLLEKATKILCKNKEVLLTAAIAFSLGMLVSRKLGSNQQE
ncbi:inactive protein RESTRICTED TEV MOVEMENT 2 [Ricinus communis]|uniref:SHSP domain-containing protein n=1 Tax=Ricinus communis TaxID=3988 RepID=B9R949_RICCO|nr:inactive protein RESTRICTED TEV MOVEMENT 2 [Ricinus communis]EEF52126.1 conserved hypothetical protein [Ricinus communis]|eukprot:XP_002511524.1 inactive protein RESTRICTED TEV MOVEMENT 2 [Ricinus communis]